MGGYGSGTCVQEQSRTLVEAVPRLEVRRLPGAGELRVGQRCRLPLRPGRDSDDGDDDVRPTYVDAEVERRGLLLTYTVAGEATSAYVLLTLTPCHFGGFRFWFRCPGLPGIVPCGRRVATLYLDERAFRCRACLGLAYESQRAGPLRQAARRVQAVRRQLGASPDLLDGDGLPPRPKGMHWRTYLRLGRAYRAADLEFGLAMIEEFYSADQHLARRGLPPGPLPQPSDIGIATESAVSRRVSFRQARRRLRAEQRAAEQQIAARRAARQGNGGRLP